MGPQQKPPSLRRPVGNCRRLQTPSLMHTRHPSLLTGFNKWIFEHELIDIGFIGPKFMWIRGISTSSFKGARLDRALCNVWSILFLEAKINIFPKLNSDHSPIFIRISAKGDYSQIPQFRFQATSLTDLGFMHTIKEIWKCDIPLTVTISKLVPKLSR